jgi:glycosyltransferase involved in cell wall biosynthesis
LKGKKPNLIVAIYSHPEYYPPTLNAISLLAGSFEEVFILHRNITGFDWVYPSNVKLVAPGKLYPVREVERRGVLQKIGWFLRFTFCFWRLWLKARPDSVIIYDALPTLSYRLFCWAVPKPRILWYHNHDVSEKQYIRPFTLGWLAWKSERWIFPRLQLFSLPAEERRQYFPMDRLKGEFIFLPNFPSRIFYGQFSRVEADPEVYKLLYQGSIGPLHGLEEILGCIREPLAGKRVQLVLKGFVSEAYLAELNSLALANGLKDALQFIGPSGYRGVVENAFTCHIGIGIHQRDDIMNRTLGTASNKIYEYAAAGMPVLVYDNPHFREKLGNFQWVFFTDVSASSIRECLNRIIRDFPPLSELARADFQRSLCFELYFLPVVQQYFSGPAAVHV